ncbi:hypothetical protein [Sphingobacterium sp.]|uniref:hypothetical protein n=1 Tax=Sphingobacterium sp. TaxID=341027 RepID=UPI00289EBFE7|nr:hypothetical protein [Sphingobacterium sp.]
MGLSNLGIFHTIVGVVALFGAIVGFVRYGKINLGARSGSVYFYATLITSVTALGLSKQGGFNAGHIFSLFILILVVLAYWLYSKKKSNRKARYVENFLLSFSFFLSLVPTINETFTRIPIGQPLAKNIKDPIIGQTLLILFILFVMESIFQFVRQKKINSRAESEII